MDKKVLTFFLLGNSLQKEKYFLFVSLEKPVYLMWIGSQLPNQINLNEDTEAANAVTV